MMTRLQMLAWIVLSSAVVFGFFGVLYLFLTRAIVIGHEQEWKFIDMLVGGLVTVFGQIMHSWMTWFVGSRRTVRSDEKVKYAPANRRSRR